VTSRRNFLIGTGAVAVAGGGAAAFVRRQMGSMDEYNTSVAATRASLSEQPAMRELIRYATLAASGHNTQPWRFRVSQQAVEILPDFTRRTPAVDPDDHHLFASLGCAAENLAIAAQATGRRGEITFDRAHSGGVRLVFDGTTVRVASALHEAIPRRQSTRAEFDGRTVSAADLRTLEAAAQVPGVDVVLITDRARINGVRDLVLNGNSAQMADAAFLRELKTWLRFSPRQAITAGDGLFSATSGNPALPSWLGPLMFDRLFKGDAENAKYARHIDSSAGLAVFVGARDDPEHWMRAGRACQRFALQATALGLKLAFINQPVEVARLRPDLAALIGLPGRRPDLVVRFGYGAALPFSARRPVDTVLA
jgi:nitroreductase